MVALAVYGAVIFTLLMVFYVLPVSLRKVYYTSYTLIEYCFFSYFIYLNLRTRNFRRVLLALTLAFVAFSVIYYLKGEFKRLDSLAIGIETILLFVYIIFYFYDYFRNPKATVVYNHYCFWISIGILIYLGSSFFFNILANHMTDKEMEALYYYTNIPEFIKNLVLVASIIVFSRQPRQPSRPASIPYLDFDVK